MRQNCTAAKKRRAAWITVRALPCSKGESGPAFISGEPDRSLLIARVRTGQMPPGGRLEASEIELLRQWVEVGGPAAHPMPLLRPNHISPRDREHWVCSRRAVSAVPPVRSRQRVVIRSTPSCSLAPELRLLAMNPEAGRLTLLRRVSFSTPGLPPSPELLERFLQDSRLDAYERVVDELAAPAMANVLARHRLDIASTMRTPKASSTPTSSAPTPGAIATTSSALSTTTSPRPLRAGTTHAATNWPSTGSTMPCRATSSISSKPPASCAPPSMPRAKTSSPRTSPSTNGARSSTPSRSSPHPSWGSPCNAPAATTTSTSPSRSVTTTACKPSWPVRSAPRGPCFPPTSGSSSMPRKPSRSAWKRTTSRSRPWPRLCGTCRVRDGSSSAAAIPSARRPPKKRCAPSSLSTRPRRTPPRKSWKR